MEISRDEDSSFTPFTLHISVKSERDVETLQTMLALAWFYASKCVHGHAMEVSHQLLPCQHAFELSRELSDYAGKTPECRFSLSKVLTDGEFQ